MKKSTLIESWKNGESVENPAGNLLANDDLGRVKGGLPGYGEVFTISGGSGEFTITGVSCNPKDWF